MYLGRIVYILDEGSMLPPIGSTVIYGRNFILSRGGRPIEGMKNVLVSKSHNSFDAVKGIELEGDEKIYVASSVEAAIYMDELAVYVLGEKKIVDAAKPYADTLPQ